MPGTSQRQRLREAQLANQRASRFRRVIVVGAAVLAVVLVVVMAVVLTQQSRQAAPAVTASPSASSVPYPPNANQARDGIVVYANAGKPVVGLYFDYQCGPCHQFDQSFGSALDLLAQTHEIELVHHTLVFLDKGNADGLSHKAALAAACADVVGSYVAYHAAIWESASQGPYTDKLLLETIPAKVGIADADLTAFRSCYSNKNLGPWLDAVENAGLKAGLTETPVLTVNGKKLSNSVFVGKSGADLKKIIEDAAKG